MKLILASILIASLLSFNVLALESTTSLTTQVEESKLRIQQYTEIMSPAVYGNGTSIPDQYGNRLARTNADGRIWLDYELGSKWKLLYWQRYVMAPTAGFLFFDPRIGIRKTNVFQVSELATTYDFFVLPGISSFAESAGRLVSIGSRTNTAYTIPKSKWTIGLVTEVFYSIYKNTVTRPSNFYGFLVPNVSYAINSLFSTQHWFVFPFKHILDDHWSNFSWDLTGAPFVQNGIGINASKNIFVGVFLNNYLIALPKLENTWASLWLNFSFI